ncbi:MAG: HNH endonuclease signature motif containing protein, partial [Nocardioidaceae bacterium]|nr:HNH endonuclease signature motif containing protein [Nocardioidaceae bacterium]
TTDIAGTLSNEDARRLEQALDDTASEMADVEGDTRPKGVRRAEALGRLVVHPCLAQTVLYLHFERVSGSWSADGIGTISVDEAEAIVGHGNITIKPVIDLAAEISTTGYVAPPRLREQLRLAQRNLCAFPYCDRRGSIRFDVDHVTPHDAGGATTTSNTHLLCRYHHRVKTHSRWKATKTAPGTTTWTSPTGQVFEVAHGLTTRLRT